MGALATLLSFALPPRCPGCGAIVSADHQLCADCWGTLTFLGPPWCARCHLPFDQDLGEDAVCDACATTPPAHYGVNAVVAYGPVARTLALRLKYGRRLGHARTIALLMRRQMPADADMLVPVPLHRWRLWSRGFNQAGQIAARLADEVGVCVADDVLLRVDASASLRGRGARQRRQTVRSAFQVPDEARLRLAGRHVVLVDDVYTTGATAAACTRALRDGGAARVTILCWARVLPHDRD